MVIWGDVAYRKDLFFSPDYWRKHFKPVVKALVDECHAHGLPVIYHGCGNVRRIFGDFIEMRRRRLQPARSQGRARRRGPAAAVRPPDRLLRQHGRPDLGQGTEEELKRVVLTKLNAAKGGGFIFQSDHSVPSNVSARNYEFVVNLVREHGRYPLRLGEFDLPDVV